MPIRNETKFMLSKPAITRFFDKNNKKIYTPSEINDIHENNKKEWRLGSTWTTSAFIKALLSKTKMKEITMEFPSRTHTRYVWGDYSIFGLIITIDAKAYFSHYSAIYLNELTEQIPKSLYLNIEQPSAGQDSSLVQKRIDMAFKLNPRKTNNIAEVDNFKVHILAGKNTSNLGVETYALPEFSQGNIRATNIERTLIDIAVRPFYAGGIGQVLSAYQAAAQKDVSINRLCQYLEKINYIYPYHQAIGFYMERSNAYTTAQLEMIERRFKKEFDFYLTYKMAETDYSSRWKLFYPKGF